MEKGEDASPHTAGSAGGANCAEGDKEGKTKPVMNFRKRAALANQAAKELLPESEETEPRVSNSTSKHHRDHSGY